MRVLVTGAARAIGRATVEVLAARGHEVVATARNPELLEGLPATRFLQLDVRDAVSVQAAVAAAGELDAVVNNAGLPGTGPLETYPIDSFAKVFDVNTPGAWPRRWCPSGVRAGAGCWSTSARCRARSERPWRDPTPRRSTPSRRCR